MFLSSLYTGDVSQHLLLDYFSWSFCLNLEFLFNSLDPCSFELQRFEHQPVVSHACFVIILLIASHCPPPPFFFCKLLPAPFDRLSSQTNHTEQRGCPTVRKNMALGLCLTCISTQWRTTRCKEIQNVTLNGWFQGSNKTKQKTQFKLYCLGQGRIRKKWTSDTSGRKKTKDCP